MSIINFNNSNGQILQDLANYMAYRNINANEENVMWYCINHDGNIVTKLWEMIYCVTDSGRSYSSYEQSCCSSDTDTDSQFEILIDSKINDNFDVYYQNYNNAKTNNKPSDDDNFFVDVVSEYEYIE